MILTARQVPKVAGDNSLAGAAPCVLVIFGITGDLAQRKLLPALYQLVKNDLLPPHSLILGVSRRDVSVSDVLNKAQVCILESDNVCDPAILKRLHGMLRMFQMDSNQASEFARLKSELDRLESKQNVCLNRLFYLSLPPQVYGDVVRAMGEHGLQNGCPDGGAASRLLIEKPFGYDLTSAEDLIKTLTAHFSEEQICRIDHYLAKETAQNILTFRLENPLFAAVWNRRHITRIDIVAAETIGIEGRAAFYDHMGALRDSVQSHLLQLLALTTMELPASPSAQDVHAARLALLSAIKPVPKDAVEQYSRRAQYDGYQAEISAAGGAAGSSTETFAAVRLFIDTERWQGTPITIRTGKNLAVKQTTITLTFDDTDPASPSNAFRFDIQPDEGISIEVIVKKPGFAARTEVTALDFNYQRTFDETGHPDAYERVLVDAIRGDRTLFATSDEVLAAWRVLQPVLNAWQAADSSVSLHHYAPGASLDDPALTL